MRTMLMIRQITGLIITLFFVAILSSCTQRVTVIENTAKEDIVWPKYPQIQRIRYLHSISTAEDMDIRPGFFKRIALFFKGEKQRDIVHPFGIRKDPEGRLFVVDSFYQRVHVFDQKNSTHYMFPDNAIESFKNPIDVAVGMNGQVYVSDSESNRIHVFSDAGKHYVKSIGAGELMRPTGLAVDTTNNRLLVTDTKRSSLVVFDESDFKVVAVVGDESEGSNGFHYPTNVALGKDGSIYVTDSLNFRVQMLSHEFQFKQTFGSAGDSPGRFSRPKGIASDSEGNVYVVDALFGNVQIFNPSGQLLLSFGKPGNEPGEFWLPNSIFIDSDDRIYISDAYNNRLQVFQYLAYGDQP